MKVGLVCAHPFSQKGGVQRHVVALYYTLKELGAEVKIIAPGNSKPDGVPEKDVIAIGRVSVRVSINGTGSPMSASLKPKKIRQMLAGQCFDLLDFHNMDTGVLTWQILRTSKTVNVLTFHGALDGNRIIRWFPFLPNVIYSLFFKGRFAGAVAVSQVAKDAAGKFLDTTIIPNGVDLSCFTSDIPPLDREEWSDGRKNLLFVGRFGEPRKGIFHLLKAYRELVKKRSDLRLIIVGKGGKSAERKVREFIKRNCLPEVYLVGQVPDDVLPSYYASSYMLCAPSLRGESFGMILLEAMACGIPPVGFANPGYQGIMQGTTSPDEKFSLENLLVSPGDWRALAERIDKLVDDKEFYEKAREVGLEYCERFTWRSIAQKKLAFYEEVVKKEGESRILVKNKKMEG